MKESEAWSVVQRRVVVMEWVRLAREAVSPATVSVWA